MRDTSSTLGKGILVLFISLPTHLCSSLVMDRQSTSPSVYKNNDEFDAMKNHLDAKMDAQMEDLKSLIKTGKRSSSSSRRRSSAHAFEIPSPVRSNQHRQHQRQEHEGQEVNTNHRSPTLPSILGCLSAKMPHVQRRTCLEVAWRRCQGRW